MAAFMALDGVSHTYGGQGNGTLAVENLTLAVERGERFNVGVVLFCRQMGFLVFEQRGFGDFELQPFRRKTRLHQRRQDRLEQIVLFELNRRDVDRQFDMRRP